MRRSDRAGFTLIEMMAAAVILAFVVMWLTGAVGDMNRREGDARRRAEAALYADRLLAELELSTSGDAAVELGKREAEEGIYQAVIEIAALDPALLPVAGGAEQPARPEGASAVDALAGGWLASPEAQANPPVLQATIRVTGKDGVFEAGVTRTSFFLNPAALEPLAGESESETDGGDEETAE